MMFKIYNSNRKYIDNFSIIKKKIAFCLLFSLFFNLIALSVTREDVYNYIDKYKNAALIVLNSLRNEGAGFQCQTNLVTILDRNGKKVQGELKDKKQVAEDIVTYVIDYMNNKKSL